jgi:hypothetical protein
VVVVVFTEIPRCLLGVEGDGSLVVPSSVAVSFSFFVFANNEDFPGVDLIRSFFLDGLDSKSLCLGVLGVKGCFLEGEGV